MTIHLISFASILHKQVSLRSSHEAILSEIEKYYTVKFVDHQDMDKLSSDDFKIIFVATGGVERLVIQHFENLPRPAILLADGMQNSLAAALEISSAAAREFCIPSASKMAGRGRFSKCCMTSLSTPPVATKMILKSSLLSLSIS